MRRAAKPFSAWFAGVLLTAPPAFAHSFYDRYDLPVPLQFFLWGAALVVVLSFLIAAIFARASPPKVSVLQAEINSSERQLSISMRLTKILSLALFVLCISAALWGTGNPLMNLAPSFVWVTWWVGFSLLLVCTGNIWPVFDPWRTLHECLGSRSLNRSWLDRMGMYPAVMFLLAWSWFEVVYPIAVVPRHLGILALVWTVWSLVGMFLFGRETWQSKADFFAISFSFIAHMGMNRKVNQHAASQSAPGFVGFVMAMLSTVLFDGLHGNQIWLLLEENLLRLTPETLSSLPYFAGTCGLLLVWLVFVASYYFCCLIAVQFAPHLTTKQLANQLAPSLIPIAVAYLVAHNFSNLVIQGQNVVFLLSDPFGWGWNIFGTRDFKPSSDLMTAEFSWYLAITSIVMGHVIALWLAHCTALAICSNRKQALWLSVPQTGLMIAYTMLSLLIIAEPLIQA